MLAAARRTALIAFQRSAAVQDDYGEESPTWVTFARALASIRFGTGDERRQAASEQRQQTVTLRVLATAKTRSVTIEDRGVWRGIALDIVGVSPISRAEIEFTALLGAAVPAPGALGQFDFSAEFNSGLLALLEDDWAEAPSPWQFDFSDAAMSGLVAVLEEA